jgi:hypothetical protein
MEPDEEDNDRWSRHDQEIKRLSARIKALEEALPDYALHYGLTDLARQTLLDTRDGPAGPKGEER